MIEISTDIINSLTIAELQEMGYSASFLFWDKDEDWSELVVNRGSHQLSIRHQNSKLIRVRFLDTEKPITPAISITFIDVDIKAEIVEIKDFERYNWIDCHSYTYANNVKLTELYAVPDPKRNKP